MKEGVHDRSLVPRRSKEKPTFRLSRLYVGQGLKRTGRFLTEVMVAMVDYHRLPWRPAAPCGTSSLLDSLREGGKAQKGVNSQLASGS